MRNTDNDAFGAVNAAVAVAPVAVANPPPPSPSLAVLTPVAAPAIRVRNLSKVYPLVDPASRATTAAEALGRRLRNPLGRVPRKEFWALRDVSLEVAKGDVVGVIGRNGAGKSTLLKILSRITEPTAGSIELFGRVGSLLEVGTGFHPELTGRENIFLNGAILGMRRGEIRSHFDEIVAFAEVEKFLDTPVKRYSSGMYVRLAFAVAAHLQPEILIVDEVLAVGDAEFQKKCLGKMRDVAASGRTVLFVSHNMATVRQLCRTVILMRSGSVARQGEAAAVVAEYLAAAEAGADGAAGCPVVSKHGIELAECMLRDPATGRATRSPLFGRAYELVVGLRSTGGRFAGAGVNVVIHGEQGVLVSTLSAVQEGLGFLRLDGGMTRLAFDIPTMQLYPGRYTVSVSVKRPNDFTDYLGPEGVTSFTVEPAILGGATWPYERKHGLVRVCEGARVVDE